MSREIYERISAWFEPKPTTQPDLYLASNYWISERMNGTGQFRWASKFDYDTDEAANARLLEAMPHPELTFHREVDEWACLYNCKDGLRNSYWHKDRKIAVRKAFCKFAGLELGGGDGD